jgi:nucleoside-diphosphate-sugar epimerase
MKVLIIGGTGLISTSLSRQLLDKGYSVTLYNRGQSESRVPAGVRQLHGDRKDYAAFEAQMRAGERFDCVIDMICYHPHDAESLVRAFRGSTEHVIFCSTVDVYARPFASYPLRDDAPRAGLTDYGKNKVLCEDVLLAAHERGDFALTVLRPAQTYGEGGPLIHTFGWGTWFVDRLRKGKPIVVHGDGMSLWVACHIDDVAGAFSGAIGNSIAYGRSYHVTGEEWMTWDGYHERVAQALGVKLPRLVHVPSEVLNAVVPDPAGIARWNFQFDNIFDNSAARRDLGFRYTVPFVEGARRTIAHLDAQGRVESWKAAPYYDRFIAQWDALCAQLKAGFSKDVAPVAKKVVRRAREGRGARPAGRRTAARGKAPARRKR